MILASHPKTYHPLAVSDLVLFKFDEFIIELALMRVFLETVAIQVMVANKVGQVSSLDAADLRSLCPFIKVPFVDVSFVLMRYCLDTTWDIPGVSYLARN